MLKQRLLTAGLLIPLVVAAIYLLPSHIIHYLLLFIAALASIEWFQVTGFGSKIKFVMSLVVVLSCFFVWQSDYLQTTLAVSGLFWLLATLVIGLYAHKPFPDFIARLLHLPATSLLSALVLFSGFTIAARLIHQTAESGPALLLYVLVAVWLADTGGYFAGKRFGKHKLAKVISPNKTWEGVAGAWLLSSIWAVLFFFLISTPNLPLWQWIIINLAVVSISVVGDLFESVFKRQFNVKDSGNLLPGHGGMLDRIDSLLAAFPVFALMMMSLGVI